MSSRVYCTLFDYMRGLMEVFKLQIAKNSQPTENEERHRAERQSCCIACTAHFL